MLCCGGVRARMWNRNWVVYSALVCSCGRTSSSLARSSVAITQIHRHTHTHPIYSSQLNTHTHTYWTDPNVCVVHARVFVAVYRIVCYNCISKNFLHLYLWVLCIQIKIIKWLPGLKSLLSSSPLFRTTHIHIHNTYTTHTQRVNRKKNILEYNSKKKWRIETKKKSRHTLAHTHQEVVHNIFGFCSLNILHTPKAKQKAPKKNIHKKRERKRKSEDENDNGEVEEEEEVEKKKFILSQQTPPLTTKTKSTATASTASTHNSSRFNKLNTTKIPKIKGQVKIKHKRASNMPSASFSSSKSYVRRSRRKGTNRIALPSRTSSGKNKKINKTENFHVIYYLQHWTTNCDDFEWHKRRKPHDDDDDDDNNEQFSGFNRANHFHGGPHSFHLSYVSPKCISISFQW